jgi:hypothetical protein
MKRRCAKCGYPKPIDDFSFKNKAKGLRNSYCKECMKPIRRNHYHNNPEPYRGRAVANKKAAQLWFFQWLSTKSCIDCGETDPVVLECDHVRGVKLGTVSHLLQSGSRLKLLTEMDKCEVRCANCHKKKTAREKGWYKFIKSRSDIGASDSGSLLVSKSSHGSSNLSALAKYL